MFGTLRFFFALFIAASHVGWNILPVTVFGGAPYVVGFYILAGYVMAYAYENKFTCSLRGCGTYYLDRIFRIFPAYLFYVLLTVIFFLVTGFKDPHFKLLNVVNNIMIVPVNFFIFIREKLIISNELNYWFIPPAWSLGAEIQFYVILPLLMQYSVVVFLIMILSLIVSFLGIVGLIDYSIYGYYLIPGTLFLYISGVMIYYHNYKKSFIVHLVESNEISHIFWKYSILFIYLCQIFFLFWFLSNDKLSSAYVQVGYLVLLPIILVLSKVKKRMPIDVFLGNISYSLFLCHFLALWMCRYFSGVTGISIYPFEIVAFSVFLAWVGYYAVERPARIFRKHLLGMVL